LDEEILQACCALAKVVARRATCSKRPQLLNAVLAPIRRVPAEILAEIFTHCVQNDAHSLTNPRYAPLLLGRVCGLWRNVSISTAVLW
ncbi:hypothetical protein C8R43DRAFT_832370, partial [Mycena crocata]